MNYNMARGHQQQEDNQRKLDHLRNEAAFVSSFATVSKKMRERRCKALYDYSRRRSEKQQIDHNVCEYQTIGY
jgi:hypothetical protein